MALAVSFVYLAQEPVLIGKYLKPPEIGQWAMVSLWIYISLVNIFLSVSCAVGAESDSRDEREIGPATKLFTMWLQLNRKRFYSK